MTEVSDKLPMDREVEQIEEEERGECEHAPQDICLILTADRRASHRVGVAVDRAAAVAAQRANTNAIINWTASATPAQRGEQAKTPIRPELGRPHHPLNNAQPIGMMIAATVKATTQMPRSAMNAPR